MAHTVAPCNRRWWQRPPVWFIALAAVLIAVLLAVEMGGKAPATPYGAFLDQLDAGNVASVTFEGTEIQGRFKRPLGDAAASGAVQRDVFRTRVPDFGDPALISRLRAQGVAIDVAQPSAWTWLLGRVPFPMLVILAVVLVAGIARLLRGRQVGLAPAGPGMPAHPMIGLLSGLFARQRAAEPTSVPDHDGPARR
jgi:ATP-dependent Zn protease